jgi:hypothetical protein
MRRIQVLAVLAALLIPAYAANAQLSIMWYKVAGGGGASTGGTFTLRGTIGQHDAGPAMSGGTFSLTGGFWAGGDGGPGCPGNECGTSDYNGDGDFGTDADIEAFFACLAGNCCETCFCQGSDFNGDGDFGTDGDIEAFFRVLAGGAC